MKKKLLSISLFVYFTFILNGQVIINEQAGDAVEESVALQVNAGVTAKGVKFPEVELKGINNKEPFTTATLEEGLVVYHNGANNLEAGYYFWNGNNWLIMGKLTPSKDFIIYQKIDPQILGYLPSGSIEDILKNPSDHLYTVNVQKEKKTMILKGCTEWIEDPISAKPGYGYCAFELYPKPTKISNEARITWEQAYDFAKKQGGYLLTLPQAAEWEWVKKNVIEAYALEDNIWLGYNKIQAPGEAVRSKWITGEKWTVDWQLSTGKGAKVQQAYIHNNLGSEPNNFNKEEGCTAISYKGYHAMNGALPDRGWIDFSCDPLNLPGKPGEYKSMGDFSQIIVKYGGLED